MSTVLIDPNAQRQGRLPAKDVCIWLEEIGLPQYKEVFVENDINGPALLDLNKQELQEELGITSFGHRKLILKKIGELKEKELRQSTQEEAILYKKIGSGASAEVYHGLWKGQECAVKIVNTSDIRPELLRRVADEIAILRSLHHENIVNFYGKEEKENELRIYMEYLPQSLHQFLSQRKKEGRPLNVSEVRRIALDVAKGLDYLHSHSRPIIHRDVKSKNVLIDAKPDRIDAVKLCDFGISRTITESTLAETRIGTVRFMAPEVINGAKYTQQADIWSYGMLLYEIITLQAPYSEESNHEEIQRKIAAGVVPQLPKDLDKSLEPFTVMISRCLQPNPEARPSAREIVDLLEAGPAPLPRSATAVLPKSGLTASGNALPLLPQEEDRMQEKRIVTIQAYRACWAVIISVSEYPSPEVPPATYASNDAFEMESFLYSKGFHIISLRDDRATKESIEEVLGEFLKFNMSDSDCLLVFISLQTSILPSGSELEIFLMPYDCTPAKLVSRGISLDRLNHFAKHIDARHILFVIDGCVSTSRAVFDLPGNDSRSLTSIEQWMKQKSVQLISAGSAPNPLFLTNAVEGPQTVFVRAILEGLRGVAFGRSDYLSAQDLASWVQHRVAQETNHQQFPTYERLGFGEGSFIFFKKNLCSEEEPPRRLSLPNLLSPSTGSERRTSLNAGEPITMSIICSSPLLSDAELQGLPYLPTEYYRFSEQVETLVQALAESKREVRVRNDFATMDNLRNALRHDAPNSILHWIDESPPLADIRPGFVMLEDAQGNAVSTAVADLQAVIAARERKFRVVIITGRNARTIAEAFVRGGVKHVIACCQSPISEPSSLFQHNLYGKLLQAECTVQAAFDVAKALVLEEYSATYQNLASDLLLLPDNADHLEEAFPGAAFGEVHIQNPIFVTNIPPRALSNSLFVGRHEELRQLITAVSSNRRVYLIGRAGVGKTSLVQAFGNFCSERRLFPDGVYYVDMSSCRPAGIAYHLANALLPAGMVHSDQDLVAQFHHRSCVLVLDNCDHLISDNTNFNPLLRQLEAGGKGVRFLITVRPQSSTNLSAFADRVVVHLSELQPQEATDLLLRLSPTAGPYVEQIVSLVGNLPLTLNIIGRWMSSSGTPAQDVVQILKQKKGQEIVDKHVVESAIVSFYESLEEQDREHFVALAIFPGSFDAEAASAVMNFPDGKKFLKRMIRNNLIDHDANSRRYLIHAIVQSFLRRTAESMPAETRFRWARAYIEYYTNLLARANYLHLQGRENGLIIFDRERHNIQHAMSLAKVSPVFHPYFCSLADAGRDLFYARYHPIERVNIYTDAVLFARASGNKLLEASLLIPLGCAYERIAEYAKADTHYRSALSIRESLLGPNHHLVAEVLKYLGILYFNPFYVENLEEAGMMLQRCVAIRESCMGPTHPETAISYSHYATLLRAAKKDAAKAELLYNRALAILQSGSNPNSAQVAGVLNDQGMLFALTRREKEAEAAFLKIWRKIRHPDLSKVLNNLANLYKQQKKFAQAELLYHESIEIRERNGEKLAISQNYFNLGNLYLEHSKFAQAEAALLKALEIRERYLGRENRLFRNTLDRLIRTYQVQGKFKEAEAAMQRWKSSKRLPTAPSSDLPSKVVRGNQTIMESVSQPLLSGPPPQPAEMDPFRRPMEIPRSVSSQSLTASPSLAPTALRYDSANSLQYQPDFDELQFSHTSSSYSDLIPQLRLASPRRSDPNISPLLSPPPFSQISALPNPRRSEPNLYLVPSFTPSSEDIPATASSISTVPTPMSVEPTSVLCRSSDVHFPHPSPSPSGPPPPLPMHSSGTAPNVPKQPLAPPPPPPPPGPSFRSGGGWESQRQYAPAWEAINDLQSGSQSSPVSTPVAASPPPSLYSPASNPPATGPAYRRSEPNLQFLMVCTGLSPLFGPPSSAPTIASAPASFQRTAIVSLGHLRDSADLCAALPSPASTPPSTSRRSEPNIRVLKEDKGLNPASLQPDTASSAPAPANTNSVAPTSVLVSSSEEWQPLAIGTSIQVSSAPPHNGPAVPHPAL